MSKTHPITERFFSSSNTNIRTNWCQQYVANNRKIPEIDAP